MMDLRHGNVYEIEFEAQLQGIGAGIPSCKIVAGSVAEAVSIAPQFWPSGILVSVKLVLLGVTYMYQA
jgi:hypothetical protein